MTSKNIDIIISTILKATGIDAAKRALSSLTTHTKNFAVAIGRNLMNVKSAFDLVIMGTKTFVSAMSKGMEFESMTRQFKTLVGSIEQAKTHMLDLQELGKTPPFSLEQFANTSRQMLVMTNGVVGFKDELKLVGDIAAATGNDIESVGKAFGLAYQLIRDGQDFGNAGSQLVQLGVATKSQVNELSQLSKAGASNTDIWNRLVDIFDKYDGAMQETEETTQGLVESIKGEATVALTEFSTVLAEEAKPLLQDLLDYLRKINEDGSIQNWAASVAESLGNVSDVITGLKNSIGNLWNAISNNLSPVNNLIKDISNFAGKWQYFATRLNEDMSSNFLTGNGKFFESIKRAYKEAEDWYVEQNYKDDNQSGSVEYNGFVRKNSIYKSIAEKVDNERLLEKQLKDDQKTERENRAKERSKSKQVQQSAIESDLLRAQEEIDRKHEQQKKKEQAEEERKQEESIKKEIEFYKSEIKKVEAEIHQIKVNNIKDEIKVQQEAQSRNQDAKQYAQTEFEKAFAMYRSEDKGASIIAEERDYAKDYNQLKKDAQRYGGKWRIDELSELMAAGDIKGQSSKLEEWRKSSSFTPEVESMVRAAAADNTQTTAEAELRQININTRGLSDKLDQLLQVK